jgi:hypothetical protein
MLGQTFAKAMANADAFKAIGQKRIYLSDLDDNPENFPWGNVTSIESGNLHGWTGVRSINLIAEMDNGLSFHWSVEFSEREGRDKDFMSYFDRDRLIDVMTKLPVAARVQFANFLVSDVVPKLDEVTNKVRTDLGALQSGQATVATLIAFGRAK